MTQDTTQIPAEQGQEVEIDILELMGKLLESLRFIILLALIGALLMAGFSFFLAVPMYESTARIYVVTAKDSVIDLSAMQIGSYLTSDYQEVLKTWEVHEQVKQNLGLDYTYEQLEGMMSVENPSNTRIISITIKSDEPREAANIANAYANVASDFISDTMLIDRPSIMSVALPAELPFSPNKTRNTIIGFALGALLAAAVVTVRFVMNDRITSADDIQRYIGIPTLATVPLVGGNEKQPRHNKPDIKPVNKTMGA